MVFDQPRWKPIREALTPENLRRAPSVLLKTDKGAWQGEAVLETRNGTERVYWRLHGLTNRPTSVTDWEKAPGNPYADPASWNARPKPPLENGKAYLVFLSPLGWVKAVCRLRNRRSPKWQFVYPIGTKEFTIRYWLDLPIQLEDCLTEWRIPLLQETSEAWT